MDRCRCTWHGPCGPSLALVEEVFDRIERQLEVVVGAVGKGIPVDKQSLPFVDDRSDELLDRFHAGSPDRVHDGFVHPVAATVLDQWARVLTVKVGTGFADDPRVDSGIADVGEGYPNADSEGEDLAGRFAPCKSEADVAVKRALQPDFAKELLEPGFDLGVILRDQAASVVLDDTRNICHNFRFFDGRARYVMGTDNVPNDDPFVGFTDLVVEL